MRLVHHALPLVLAALLALPVATPAAAGEAIEVVHPWARPTIPNRPGVVYLEIHNPGETPDRLLGASVEGVGKAELHKAEQTGGVMRMSRVEAIEVPAGGMAHLGPGGYHIMLFDIAEPLGPGDSLALTLEFERAGAVPVTVPVRRGAPDSHGGQQNDGHRHEATQGHGDAGN